MAATLQQDKLCCLLGWSGWNNTQTALSFNKSAWFNLVKCTTAGTKQEFTKTHFCIPLQEMYGWEVDFTKHQGFIKMLETFSFTTVLDADPSKVTHYLSPLCFFELHKGALISTNYYDALNQQASVNTTSDIEKACLGQLMMPWSPLELIAVLNQMLICLQFMFHRLCRLAQEIISIYQVLENNQHKYIYGAAFENGTCKTICNGISKGCERLLDSINQIMISKTIVLV